LRALWRQVWPTSAAMGYKPVLLETLPAEIYRQARTGQRPSATVVGLLKAQCLAFLHRMIPLPNRAPTVAHPAAGAGDRQIPSDWGRADADQ
jgi:hypothetical protein